MPFTPLHMGPGLLLKVLLQGSFSLMVFGWTQIVMDLQPLYVILSGQGTLHGLSHTYAGASVLAVAAAISGKCLSELGLQIATRFFGNQPDFGNGKIAWRTAFLSAFVGAWSHVLLDDIMHVDVMPLGPWSGARFWHSLIGVDALNLLCLLSGLLGALLYVIVRTRTARR